MSSRIETMDNIFEIIKKMKQSIGFVSRYDFRPNKSSDLTTYWPEDGSDRIRNLLLDTCTKDNTVFTENGIECHKKKENIDAKVSCEFLEVAGVLKVLCTNKVQHRTPNGSINKVVQKYDGHFYPFDE